MSRTKDLGEPIPLVVTAPLYTIIKKIAEKVKIIRMFLRKYYNCEFQWVFINIIEDFQLLLITDLVCNNFLRGDLCEEENSIVEW